MKTYCDKKHRIKHRKDGTFATPQWKGRFFWHSYTYYPLDMIMGNLIIYGEPRHPEFDTFDRALKFIHAAMENEKNKGAKIGVMLEREDCNEDWR